MPGFVVLLLVWLSLNLTGCAAVVVAGAAGAGYLATDEEAGESASEFFKNIFSRKVSSTEKTRETLGYEEDQGLVIRLLDQTVQPKQVRPGETITVTAKYAMMGGAKEGTVLRFRQSLWYKKKRLAEVVDRRFECANGTWEDSFKISVSDMADAGGYALGIVLSVDGEPKIPEEKGHVVFYVKK